MPVLQSKSLFNPKGSEDLNDRRILGGNSTNLLNLNNVKYQWAVSLDKQMEANFWIANPVDLTQDKIQYSQLSNNEKKAFFGQLSFLVFLDSIQTNNIPRLASFISAPEIVTALTHHAFQERNHTKCYSVMIEAILGQEDKQKIYDFWREDDILFKRNQDIVKLYDDFNNNPTVDNFYRSLIANYVLEGVYFVNSFNYFFNLASRSLMSGSADMIRLISIDEQTHIVLFERLITSLIKELPLAKFREYVEEIFSIGVEQEIEWSSHIIGDNVLGINKDSIDQYTKYTANRLMRKLGVDPIYTDPKYFKNPYQHLDLISDVYSEGTQKGNFFETNLSEYSNSNAIEGWDF